MYISVKVVLATSDNYASETFQPPPELVSSITVHKIISHSHPAIVPLLNSKFLETSKQVNFQPKILIDPINDIIFAPRPSFPGQIDRISTFVEAVEITAVSLTTKIQHASKQGSSWQFSLARSSFSPRIYGLRMLGRDDLFIMKALRRTDWKPIM